MPQLRAAVLGSPIGHSLSPILHRTAYAGLGLDWRYDAVDVDLEGLGGFLAGLDETWMGLSLTMPLKSAVLELLASASDLVWAIGAANTVLPRPAGWYGENTDVVGIISALASIGAPNGETVILGAGGTARAAIAACARRQAPRVRVLARRPAAAGELVMVGESLGLRVDILPWPAGRLPARDEAPVLISTVPAPATHGILDLVPSAPGWLLDVTYHPWPSRLAERWRAAGGVAAGGARMLVAQAAAQVELMTGRRPDIAAMGAALDRELAQRATALR
jgi:shikimate dehydrogenase